MVLFHEPLLSGDVYRYLSDGRVLASGGNPYAYTPTDPRINHREIRSIYPPHAEILFAAVHTLLGWRLLIIAADIAAILLLRRHGAALAYATCPLVIFEGTWSGHVDLIAGVVLGFALVWSRSPGRRPVLAGVASGLASGLKVIPLAALPPLLRNVLHNRGVPSGEGLPTASRIGGRDSSAAPRDSEPAPRPGFWSRKPLRFIAAFGATLAVPVLPFIGGPIMPGLHDYATRWIFFSPLYELIRSIVERIPIKAFWTASPLRFAAISDFVYRHIYPDFVTRAILAVLAIAGILMARRVSTAIAILLVCSPAIHPWYWLTLVPAALIERRWWLYVGLCAPLSYLMYEGVSPSLVYGWAAVAVVAAFQTRIAAHR